MDKLKVNLKKVLKRKNISQYELAKRLDLPPHHITKMIKPGYNPTLKTIGKICYALDCRMQELIEE